MKLSVCAIVIAGALSAWSTASGYAIRGFVVANGGMSSTGASNGTHRVYGTVGLPGVAMSQGGSSQVCSGFWCFGGSRVLDVDPARSGAPRVEFALGPARPNPARDRARFDLALPRTAMVTLTVFDVAGRRVGDPVSRRFAAGTHELTWRAESAGPGVYFVRVATDGAVRTQRTVVLVK